VKIVDLFDNISAPDEVEVAVVVGQVVDDSVVKRDPVGQSCRFYRAVGPLDVDRDRVYADPGDLMLLDDPDVMRGVAASRVEDDVGGLEVRRRKLVESVGPFAFRLTSRCS
jgi:hypothetical protein